MGEGAMKLVEAYEPSKREMPGVLSLVGAEIQSVSSNTTETNEKVDYRHFKKLDEFLGRRAEEFYSMRVYNMNMTARFRFLNRALQTVTNRIDPASGDWRHSFDAVPAINHAEENRKTKIRYDQNGSYETILAGTAFSQQPEIRSAVLNQLREVGPSGKPSAAMHIYDYLNFWIENQVNKPSDQELRNSKNALDLFLFSVHGRQIIGIIDQYFNGSEAVST